MTVKLEIPHEFVIKKYLKYGEKDPFGCQPFASLSEWVVFHPDIRQWIDENAKCKSGIRLRYRSPWSENLPNGTIHHKISFYVYFKNDRDGVLFKLFWHG